MIEEKKTGGPTRHPKRDMVETQTPAPIPGRCFLSMANFRSRFLQLHEPLFSSLRGTLAETHFTHNGRSPFSAHEWPHVPGF